MAASGLHLARNFLRVLARDNNTIAVLSDLSEFIRESYDYAELLPEEISEVLNHTIKIPGSGRLLKIKAHIEYLVIIESDIFYEDKWLTLSPRNGIPALLSYIKREPIGALFLGQGNYSSLDYNDVSYDEGSLRVTFSVIVNEDGTYQTLNKVAGFFNKINMATIYNFEREQILNYSPRMDEIIDERSTWLQEAIRIVKEPCIIKALLESKISEELKTKIMSNFPNCKKYINIKDLHSICKILEIRIDIKKYDKRQDGTYTYGKEFSTTVQIALHNDHFFYYEPRKYSRSFAEEYINPLTRERALQKYKLKPNIIEGKQISNLRLIGMLEDAGLMIEHDILQRLPIDINMQEEKISLDHLEYEQVGFRFLKKDPTEIILNLFADLETAHNDGSVNDQNQRILEDYKSEYYEHRHVPILGTIRFGEHTITFQIEYGKSVWCGMRNAVAELIKEFKKNTKEFRVNIYFHNSKYDSTVLSPELNYISVCRNRGQVYYDEIIIEGVQVKILDSYKMLPYKLSELGDKFKLPENLRKQECVNYEWHNDLNNINKFIPIEEYRNLLNETQQKLFDEVIKKESQQLKVKHGFFNPTALYAYYNVFDVKVLQAAFHEFQLLINEIIDKLNKQFKCNHKINISQFNTISSLAHYICCIYGAYEGTFMSTGHLRRFISQAVHGGRTTCTEVSNGKYINKKVAGEDANSLYPSAIMRMPGVPIGKAKRIYSPHYEDLCNKDYYVINIVITEVNKRQNLPMIRYQNDNKTIDYVNEARPDVITVDKFYLEDLIRFHKIKFHIIDGVYWNECFNTRLKQIIQILYDFRLEAKKGGKNSLDEALKLMLNSIYGKTIMKTVSERLKIIPAENFDSYFTTYYHVIKEVKKLNSMKFYSKECNIDASYSMPHVGTMILSMSKRIMNEVVDILTDAKAEIYYTDTDSLYYEAKYRDILISEYHRLYDKDLIGKQLGQFKNDLDVKGESAVAIDSVFVQKKLYVCVLQSIENPEKMKIKMRSKGVSEEALKRHIDINFKGDSLEFFKSICNKSETIEMVYPGSKPHFKFGINYVKSESTFSRTIGLKED
jgi:hypothetical protein